MAEWKLASEWLPCDRDPRCRGVQPGEFYFYLGDGRAIHALGFCRDAEGKHLPNFPWDRPPEQPR